MSSHRVYISASTQKQNIGVGQYGTEQDRMQALADRIMYWLKTQKGRFTVFRNQPGWTLQQTTDDCNSLACDLFIDNHTNAGATEKVAGDGGAEGTEVYYNGKIGRIGNGYNMAYILYKYISPLSLGKDRGVLPDTNLYTSGLHVIQHTKPPAILIEHFFHTNYAEVEDYLKRIDEFAKAEAKAVVEYFNEKWEEPQATLIEGITSLVSQMMNKGLITGPTEYWVDVLKGKIPAKPEFLQIVFNNAVKKL